jgi:hypothetical protein
VCALKVVSSASELLKVQAQGGVLEAGIAANGTGLAAGALKTLRRSGPKLKDLREALEAAVADRDAATKDRDAIQKKLDDVMAELATLKKVCAA